MPITFHDDMLSSLNFDFATGATGGEVREKSLSVFSDRGMTSSHAGEAGT